MDDRSASAALDLRDLPAPLPLERALACARALRPGQRVTILTPHLPTPLLDLLADSGLRLQATPCADGSARVVIECPAGDRDGQTPA